MIYFITNCPYHLEYYTKNICPDVTVLPDNDSTFKLFKNWAAKRSFEQESNNDCKYIGYDVESNGLDAWMNSTILKVLGDQHTQFLFHTPYCTFRKYIRYAQQFFRFLGHNIKFDLKFTLTEDATALSYVYDTMIAEQRLYMKSGIGFALSDLFQRYLNVYPEQSDKSIREEFIGCDVHKFKVLPRHIYYTIGDIDKLFHIKNRQIHHLNRYKMVNLLSRIEFPLIPIIAEAEVEGWDFDKEGWLKVYDKNKADRFELECKMDEEVRRLRDTKFKNEPDKSVYLKGGKWDNKRIHNPEYDLFNDDGTVNSLNLFGEPMKTNTYLGSKAKTTVKIKDSPNNINYSSDTQILELFGRLEEPVMDSSENLLIPQFKKNGKLNRDYSYTTKEEYFILYKSMLPNSIMIPFIDMLLDHRSLSTAISTFGANVINKINPITGKLHSIYRQAAADTGRMQSGGGKKEPDKINAQNIPSKASWAKAMRNCFIAPEGWSIGTHDYSGAELIVMSSLSKDMKLLEISKGDMHSYVAQACWRNIYAYRAKNKKKQLEHLKTKGNGLSNKDSIKDCNDAINDLILLSQSYIVNKLTEGGKVRTDFKPMTFKEKFVSLQLN
ncbi:MAG: hypothetical protein CMC35_03090 [Flavobacteriaceae bacterium]|nr:hypothetical protein [Flavobacteriaceae bacterium]